MLRLSSARQVRVFTEALSTLTGKGRLRMALAKLHRFVLSRRAASAKRLRSDTLGRMTTSGLRRLYLAKCK
eukprot:gene44100-29886_t